MTTTGAESVLVTTSTKPRREREMHVFSTGARLRSERRVRHWCEHDRPMNVMTRPGAGNFLMGDLKYASCNTTCSMRVGVNPRVGFIVV